ncbi:hypothetical protein E2C01_032807 [Portunus trituberculatus]|uniref:Uncharacterized protein n=1 Tax=Portunus trituberculatus TaxID=210409 RepID=A0A5B7F1Q5_PORTR|nr:hypothetical protein [Portunus trituberculatus]
MPLFYLLALSSVSSPATIIIHHRRPRSCLIDYVWDGQVGRVGRVGWGHQRLPWDSKVHFSVIHHLGSFLCGTKRRLDGLSSKYRCAEELLVLLLLGVMVRWRDL